MSHLVIFRLSPFSLKQLSSLQVPLISNPLLYTHTHTHTHTNDSEASISPLYPISLIRLGSTHAYDDKTATTSSQSGLEPWIVLMVIALVNIGQPCRQIPNLQR